MTGTWWIHNSWNAEQTEDEDDKIQDIQLQAEKTTNAITWSLVLGVRIN